MATPTKSTKKSPNSKKKSGSRKKSQSQSQSDAATKPSVAKSKNASNASNTSKAPKPKFHLFALIGLGALILIIGLVFLFSQKTSSNSVDDSAVAASVNGVEITQRQLETQYAILPDQYKQIYSKEMILQQLIDEELLLQYARENGADATSEEVNQEIQSILESGQLSLTELQENLDAFNLSIDDFERLIARKIVIQKGMTQLMGNLPEITDADAREYYDLNSAQYVVENQVTVKHILIASQRDNAASLAKDLKEKIDSGEDICPLVEEFTDDKGSVSTCGEYTFPKGFMVPEFEQASFNMNVGDTTVVQTQFGYHVIKKFADIPAHTQNFNDVKQSILQTLGEQARVALYQRFLVDAKEKSTIVLG